MNKAVFLDRDGVVNHAFVREGKSYPPQRLEELCLIDGVFDACMQLKASGYLLIVVTNQPDVATGKQQKPIVEEMHHQLMDKLPLDAIYVCYHSEVDNCICRKPKTGMFQKAALDLNVELLESFMVGDRWKDIDAGKLAGCKTFFIDYNYNEKKPMYSTFQVNSLLEASNIILEMA